MPEDELYPLDQVDWNLEQTRFKDVMRAVVYRTQGIYFDGVKDSEDETAVQCQLWTQGEDEANGGEWMRWYAVSKDYLHTIDFEALVKMAKEVCEALRDGDDGPMGSVIKG